jgi:betaine-aldehyde dehydrogenase
VENTATALVKTHPAQIGGEQRFAADGRTLDVTNPADGTLIARIPRCGADDVDAAVGAAKSALADWKRLEPTERASYVHRLADLIERDKEALAALDSQDNGTPVAQMRNDVAGAVEQMRYFAGLAVQNRGATIPSGHDRLNYTLRQPYGVVGRIIPFNHPFKFAAVKAAVPLIAGNTVVLKPSEHTSLSALALGELAAEALPPGVLNVITGLGSEAGDALVAHPDVPRLAFIGASATGRAILARAASVAVKQVTLELGGKNPVVIFSDADEDLAIAGVIKGMNFTWQGQSCGSTSRLLVQRDRYDAFIEKLADRIRKLRTGLPDGPDTQVGAIVTEAQLDKVLRYVDIGRDEGARLVVGGERVTDGVFADGLFVRPALFADVKPASRLAQEEIFGPVLAAMPFDDYDEAMRIANSVQYGLTASVFTKSLATAHAFARDVEAGYVWVNETSRHVAGTPFGGYKDSGLGREEDLSELESYTQTKNVHVRFE